MKLPASIFAFVIICEYVGLSEAEVLFAGERKLNNVVSELLQVSSLSQSSKPLAFNRPSDGWVFVAASYSGKGNISISLDVRTTDEAILLRHNTSEKTGEAMRYVAKGEHQISVKSDGKARVDKLEVRAIPELIHCGLGFNPAIKSYGLYDLNFLKKDILPNVTTLIVPQNIELPQSVVEDWHRQGKRFVAEAGINSQAKTSDEHFKYWTSLYDKAPFVDGIIINEFIINNPSVKPGMVISPERQKRMEQEQQQHQVYGEAIQKMRADQRHKEKMVYAYFGGSGKRLNQEMIGTNFIRTIVDCNYRVVPERYLFERSSDQGSTEALRAFVEGIADWEAKEPGVKKNMVIAFGLFSMPPGGINKQPNVDYHVWMDQQMNVAANDPAMFGVDGFEWWTSSLADEETVRFVGKLYRHYAIEGQTHDPLFLTHIQNADFEKGTESWILHPTEEGSIEAKHFPRYGRIEGRYMGLGRPADPEHIGDTFLWMKRNAK